MRVTLLDAKNNLPPIFGVCPVDPNTGLTSPTFLQLLNEAQERLLIAGMWWGTVQKWRFCATDGCVSLPSQFATLIAVAVCGRPIAVRDQFYEFLENGFGIRGQTMVNTSTGTISPCCGGVSGVCGVGEALYRGNFPVFSDIIPGGKQLQLVCDKLTDVGKPVLCLGYDDNNNWIRTVQNGMVLDGEVVSLAQAPGTNSVNNFSVVTDLQPPPNLDGQWWLYEFTVSGGTQRLIGQFQYYDIRPSFARYFFPAIIPQVAAPPNTCAQVLVEALVKLEFVRALRDTDYLIIGSLPALAEMMAALKKANDEADAVKRVQIISAGLTVAKQILDQQLDHYLGSGRKMGMNIVGSSIGDVHPVPVLL
jgi:hypothetical protein